VGGAVHIVPQDQLGHRRFLTLGAGFAGLAGQFVMSYLSDAIGRRKSGMLCGWGAALSLAVAGCYYDAFFGTVSVFWLLVTVASFFGVGSAALIRPYTAEVWPASLRASGMGLAYAIGSLGGLLSPLGLELIIGRRASLVPKRRPIPYCRLCSSLPPGTRSPASCSGCLRSRQEDVRSRTSIGRLPFHRDFERTEV
jgi:hypothetical protein